MTGPTYNYYKTDISQLKGFYRMWDDGGDPWGSCMSVFFELAEYMYRSHMDYPIHWEFNPSPLLDQPITDEELNEKYLFEEFRAHSADELWHFGNVLHRYSRMLRHLSLDY